MEDFLAVAVGAYVLFFVVWVSLYILATKKVSRMNKDLFAFQYGSLYSPNQILEWRDVNDLRPEDVYHFYTSNILNGNVFRDPIPDDDLGQDFKRNWKL